MIKKLYLLIILSFLIFTGSSLADTTDKGYIGTFEKWQKIEISMIGPQSKGVGEPNPFSVFVDVIFTSPTGQTYKVPGFYGGDGRGGLDGKIWKVRFSADETGPWNFISESSQPLLNKTSGSFTVISQSENAPGFYKLGRLEYPGTAENGLRYMKFRDGSYWLKAGCDNPENFMGELRNYNTWEKRKRAIDYLSEKGINSLYIMTHNIDGDNNDVWPWIGKTSDEAKKYASSNARFNILRLERWRHVFEYMQAKSMVSYIILEDDSAWSGYDHERYYREMIARFGDLPALIFNINEEHDENYSLREALLLSRELKKIDPYNHPRGIHNVNSSQKKYVQSPHVDFVSIQTKQDDPLVHNRIAIKWINLCERLKKRTLMISFDEPRPELNRRGWWSAYMGGGLWEIHVIQPFDRPMTAWQTSWKQLGGARAFMESFPFWEMKPSNTLVSSGRAFCLANEGKHYALYLPFGGEVTVTLKNDENYEYSWWNPSNDKNGNFENAGTVTGGIQTFSSPGSGDWALRIVKAE